jgi:hypothetical protein
MLDSRFRIAVLVTWVVMAGIALNPQEPSQNKPTLAIRAQRLIDARATPS